GPLPSVGADGRRRSDPGDCHRSPPSKVGGQRREGRLLPPPFGTTDRGTGGEPGSDPPRQGNQAAGPAEQGHADDAEDEDVQLPEGGELPDDLGGDAEEDAGDQGTPHRPDPADGG